MPRIKPLDGMGSGGMGLGGFRAPGLYASLLKFEREHREQVDPRWHRTAAAVRGEQPNGYYRRSRRLLVALEAGKTVLVPLPWSHTWGLPWTRAEVSNVTVAPNDVVRPSNTSCSYPGTAADEQAGAL